MISTSSDNLFKVTLGNIPEINYLQIKFQTGTFELIDITDAKAGTYECVFGLADDMKASTEIKVSARSMFGRTTSYPIILIWASVLDKHSIHHCKKTQKYSISLNDQLA